VQESGTLDGIAELRYCFARNARRSILSGRAILECNPGTRIIVDVEMPESDEIKGT
jgi:hypothetical protein